MHHAFKPFGGLSKRAVTLCAAILLLAPAWPTSGLAQTAPAPKATGKTQQKPKNFDGLTCQSDIATELIGRTMTTGKVADKEAKYKSLKLAYRGGQGMPEDPFFLGFWVVCGTDYVVLERSKVRLVKDVLTAPAPASEVEMTVGSCKAASGKALDFVVFARPAAKGQGPWNVTAAWTVREPQLEFVPVEEKSLTCQE